MLAATQTPGLLPNAIELEQTMKFSDAIARSSFCPSKYRNHPEDVFVAILMGLEVGLKPMQALQNIAVINDRPCVWGDAALALVQASGELEYIDEKIEGNLEVNGVATCTIKRKGLEMKVIRSFGIDDAKRAGLWSRDTYKKYPARMLQMRARGFALRDAFADVLKGLNIREEVEDLPVEKEITSMNPSHALIEELQQHLKAEVKPLVIEAKQPSVVKIREKIQSAQTQDELNQLTEAIKHGDYSEKDKAEMRKVFKDKKASLTRPRSETVTEHSMHSIKSSEQTNQS